MRRALVVLALALAACSDGDDGPARTVVVDSEELERHDAKVDRHNAAIDEWNALVDAGREAPYATYEEWARANGKPLEP